MPELLPGRLGQAERGRRCSRAWSPRTRTRGSPSTSSEVPLPELAPDEAYVAVMASSINFNTVWTSIFEPLPTFGFLDRLARRVRGRPATRSTTTSSARTPRGSCSAPARRCATGSPGDKVTVHCNYVDDQDPSAHDDSMLAANQRIWGFETNFGGLADVTVVKANQLMPKPAHLSWEEAAINALCNSTAYRMLVSPNGAPDDPGRQGARLGGQRWPRQLRRPARAERRGTPDRRRVVAREGRAPPRPRRARPSSTARRPDYRFWSDEHTQDESEWRRFGKDIRALVGDDPDIVFEHPGRQTMGASVFACKRGGTIVTCAATSGYMIEYDNRHLWMKLKTIKGSPLRQLPRGLGRQPAHLRGQGRPAAVRRLPARGGGRGGVPGPPQPRTRARSACCASPPPRDWASTTPSCAARVGEDRITLFRRHGAACTRASC